MNAIDTQALTEARQRLTPEEIARLRSELGILSNNVAVYTGGLYAEKRLKFLINSAARIRRALPDFELIVIGKGPDARIVEEAAGRVPWIHYLGAKNDVSKVPYWALSKVLLMPGAVGLVVLDSFALGLPMVTTAVGTHGPEIDYLRDGVNGIIVQNWESAESYASDVVDLLRDEPRRQQLVSACLQDAEKYTVQKMADLFAEGILSALQMRRYTGFSFLDWIRR